jgi:hypothetical protein
LRKYAHPRIRAFRKYSNPLNKRNEFGLAA